MNSWERNFLKGIFQSDFRGIPGWIVCHSDCLKDDRDMKEYLHGVGCSLVFCKLWNQYRFCVYIFDESISEWLVANLCLDVSPARMSALQKRWDKETNIWKFERSRQARQTGSVAEWPPKWDIAIKNKKYLQKLPGNRSSRWNQDGTNIPSPKSICFFLKVIFEGPVAAWTPK